MASLFGPFTYSQQDLQQLNIIRPSPEKTIAALTGTIKRHSHHMYRGLKPFLEDVQKLYSIDKPQAFLKNNHIVCEGDDVLPTCISCGQYNHTYKYCPNCEDVHYCSQACEMNMKFPHEREQCKPRAYPSLLTPLQVELHLGSSLGHNVELFYQHEMRWALQARGEKLLASFKGIQVSKDYTMMQINHGLRWRKESVDETGSFVIPTSLDELRRVYVQNEMVEMLQMHLLREGCILERCVDQVHDNHVHFVLVFRGM